MDHLSAGYTDEAIGRIVSSMKEAGELGILKIVDCCVIGAHAAEAAIVPVAVHPGYEEYPRNIDLYVERYLEPDPRHTAEHVNLNDTGACIRQYPYGAPRKQPFHWTIFVLDSEKRRAVVPRNDLYDKLKGGDGHRTVRGNILVVKSDDKGVVRDVLERDLFFIERLVCSYFEDDENGIRFPTVTNPTAAPMEGKASFCWRGWSNDRLDYDVLTVIAFYIPWRVLLIWRHWPSPANEIAEDEIVRRIRAAYGSHVPPSHLYKFFELLKTAFGVVAGTLPLRLMTSREQPIALSNYGSVLDIIVHAQMEDHFRSFFFELGYKFREEHPTRRFGEKVKHVEIYERVESDGSSTKVVVSVSEEHALDVLLASPTTAHLNAMTMHHLFSFFPRLAWANEALAMGAYDRLQLESDDFTKDLKVKVVENNAAWSKDCGKWCPMRRRKTYDDDGVAMYEWNAECINELATDEQRRRQEYQWGVDRRQAEKEKNSLTYARAVGWRPEIDCCNPKCQAGALREARLRYVAV